MAIHDDEGFLGRWSRRKIEARREAEPQGDAPNVPPSSVTHGDRAAGDGSTGAAGSVEHPARSPAASETPLPSVDALQGLESEYTEFLKPSVGEDTRRAALKKLFADPHFNQMDGLDVYIDDYNKFEPMSAAVAASLAVMHRLSVFDHLASEQAKDGAVAKRDAGALGPSDETSDQAGAPVGDIAAAPVHDPESPSSPDTSDERSA